ncbi:MAG: JAB domain-containing protein [Sphaerochaetaceae bacterium]
MPRTASSRSCSGRSSRNNSLTSRLRKTGELLGIQVLDHLIFSDETFHSILEENEF